MDPIKADYIVTPKAHGKGGISDWSIERIHEVMEYCSDTFYSSDKTEYIIDKYLRLYVNLSFELNRRKLIAPAFRPRIYTPAPPSPKRSEFHNKLDINMQIIDLHWVYCTHNDFRRVDSSVAHLFTSGDFKYDDAYKFAGMKWRATNKAGAIGLTPFEQWEMAMLRARQVHELRRRLLNQRDEFKEELLNYPHGQVRRFAAESADIWLARSICRYNPRYRIIGVNTPDSAKKVSLMFELISGKAVAPKVMERRVKGVMKRHAEIYGESESSIWPSTIPSRSYS